MNILFSLPDDLLHTMDKFAEEQGYNRSEFIRECIRLRLFGRIRRRKDKNADAIVEDLKVTETPPNTVPESPQPVLNDSLPPETPKIQSELERGAVDPVIPVPVDPNPPVTGI